MATIRRNGPADLKATLDAIECAFHYGEREDARRVFNVLRERGFLQRVPESDTPLSPAGKRGVFGCPVPSLASYAAARKSSPHLAAMLGDADVLTELIRQDAGAVNVRDAMGRMPLHLAAECRWADVLEALRAVGADAEVPDANGATPHEAWPEFNWPMKAPEEAPAKKNENGGGSGTSGGPGGMT